MWLFFVWEVKLREGNQWTLLHAGRLLQREKEQSVLYVHSEQYN